ncbi:ribonucleoside-diphosphate reductase subunit alpha [Marinococcus halophilus]|uniref:Ribonucleoside-diphosphate reductase n=1 Tax=Marinococcus halophilus TaxID=1371 RepID=A0A510Y1G3_MARHA|nr:ribonucleoside-diphosphate reductase subunit alpha [Marinococcus halophilus]OZT81212.1 ribonucleoside-diphosphate reductase subunit alpha [Marinococcus halophilus]GEK57146.1 ribonucleoside-diphosphate reductase [Marinococcus halophilus]
MTIVIDGHEQSEFNPERLGKYLNDVLDNFPDLPTERYKERIFRSVQARGEIKAENITELLISNAVDEITKEQPDWTFVAAHFYSKQLRKDVETRRKAKAYGNFFDLTKELTDTGYYNDKVLKSYSHKELREAGKMIEPQRDELFTYVGLMTLSTRYLAKNENKKPIELPQERFLTIALFLMSEEETSHRMELVKQAYWSLSNLYMTVATPTLANAGKTHGQLSSCFVDTVDDSLRGIYDSNTDIATLSKSGGGIGVYLGKIRSLNSDIRGFKGVSSGIVPWARQLNNTAVSVDQLGSRQGSVAIYLDVWHKDVHDFLDLKLNNGDERLRTHDLFTGVNLPDLFMEKVRDRGEWYLFDPHEVRDKKGWALEDYYDEEKGQGSFRDKYWELVDDPDINKDKVEAIDIMKRIMKSQLETGVPYMFYRDSVNRDNPNKHKGIIYCSNLCTEIMQNLSATTVKEETTDGDEIIIRKEAGDFVTCNLSSINLARAVTDDVLEELIPIQVRMLDNVIDLNNIEVKQAELTNMKYRAVGLGTFGWHTLLAVSGINYESEKAVEYADKLYEEISYLTINASKDLAKEKGAYPYFEGSDWHTGAYFDRRDYEDDKWKTLKQEVAEYGVRNGYQMAVAPNGSTSIIGNASASIDPIYKLVYVEEKKDFRTTVTAPELTPKTFWYYKAAHDIDQSWTLKQNAVRQKHIDQSQSCNLYVRNDIKAKDLLALHMQAWESKIKTTYYVRSTSVTIDECEVCSS